MTASPSAEPRRWLSQQEAAGYIGVTDRTVRRYISEGTLRAHRLAGKRAVRIDRADLEALLTLIPTTGGSSRMTDEMRPPESVPGVVPDARLASDIPKVAANADATEQRCRVCKHDHVGAE